MTETLKRLVISEISEDGISPKTYGQLPENERKLLFEKGDKYFVRPEERRKVRVVATGGVFDALHLGHVHTLKKARELGDLLVVVVATDEYAAKRKKLFHTEQERKELVGSMRCVDLALIGQKDRALTVARIKPDIIAFGYDQKPEFAGLAQVVKLDSPYKPEVLKTRKILESL